MDFSSSSKFLRLFHLQPYFSFINIKMEIEDSFIHAFTFREVGEVTNYILV